MELSFKFLEAFEGSTIPKGGKGGIETAPMWMFGGLESLAGLADQGVSQPVAPAEPTPAPEAPVLSADEEVQKLIVDNPDMNAATLWNTMKAKGIIVSKPDQPQEADSGSSMPAVLRAQESFKSNVQFTESVGADTNVGVTKFKAILIQEGLGNLRDGYYYTKEALANAVGNGIFEGKKIFADHPSTSEEQDRPERSVRDIVGHFENVKLEENEDGQSMITADAVTLPDEAFNWARALMRHAVDFSKKYPDKDFVGLSINASGKAEPMEANKFLSEAQVPEGSKQKLAQAIQEGLQTVRVVSALDSAVSCDLVTEAGAGGKVIQFLEGDKSMDEKKMENEEMKKEAAPEAPPAKDAKDAEKPHDDEEQDAALIKKMLSEYLGDGAEENEEAFGRAKESYEAYKEMGMEKEEAMKQAGQVMKLAKHMASKKQMQADADAEDKKAADEKECGDQKEGFGDKPAPDADAKDDKKESAKIAKLTGEITRLKEANRKFEIGTLLDTKLAALKESRRVTDKIRELIGEAKSEAHIDSVIKSFMGGYGVVRESKATAINFSDAIMIEKNTKPAGTKATSFGDCVN